VKLSVVIPVYNERGTVREILRRLLAVDWKALGLEREIVIVDDGSRDGTREVLREIEADPSAVGLQEGELRVVLHPVNRGKGAALRTGFEAVTGDVAVVQDADLEYDPRDLPRLLEPILDGRADVVFGNRFYGGGPHRVLYFWHYVGNKVLTTLTNVLTNLNLADMEVGYKVFRTEVLRRIRIKSRRFGVEPELTVKVARLGCRIYEVPISYHGRTYAEGKKITWRDGLVALWCLLRFRFFD